MLNISFHNTHISQALWNTSVGNFKTHLQNENSSTRLSDKVMFWLDELVLASEWRVCYMELVATKNIRWSLKYVVENQLNSNELRLEF